MIREQQTGRILAAKIISQNVGVSIEELLQEVIDLGYPILGVVSDKESSIVSAIKAKLSDIPHQLCHYHYLKNLALPMVEADSELKKKITFWLRSRITSLEKELYTYLEIIKYTDKELLQEAHWLKARKIEKLKWGPEQSKKGNPPKSTFEQTEKKNKRKRLKTAKIKLDKNLEKIKQLLVKGVPKASISKEYKVSKTTFYQWLKIRQIEGQ